MHYCMLWVFSLHSGSCGFLLIIPFFLVGSQQTRLNQGPHYAVRVTVGSGPSVLEVPVATPTHVAGDANANVAAGCGRGEIVETGGAAFADEAAHVVSATVWIVHADVLRVTGAQPPDRFFNVPVM